MRWHDPHPSAPPSPMIVTAVILLLVVLLAPILLIRFRKRWVAAFKLAITNRITSRFSSRLPGFGILSM